MRWIVEKMISSYGKNLILRQNGQDQKIAAFLQPVTGKAQRFGLLEPTVLGLADPDQYMYVGPACPEAKTGDQLYDGGQCYVVRNAEILDFGGEPLYVWGICVKKEEITP